jgi:Ras-related C3 botulinum toxin substrate 1
MSYVITSPHSFDNVRTKWGPETKFHRPNAPIILVGTSSDLRNHKPTDIPHSLASSSPTLSQLQIKGLGVITPEEAEHCRQDIGAVMHFECSALTQGGMRNIFDEAIRAALTNKPTGHKANCLHRARKVIAL